MNKILSDFEKNGGTYTKVGDYYLPDLALPHEKENIILGKYGKMRLIYLKESQKAQYSLMVINGTLKSHLRDVDEQATKILDQTVKGFAKAELCALKWDDIDEDKIKIKLR